MERKFEFVDLRKKSTNKETCLDSKTLNIIYKMKRFVILCFATLLVGAFATDDSIDPFSVEDIRIDRSKDRPIPGEKPVAKTETKPEVKKETKPEPKKEEKKEVKKDDTKKADESKKSETTKKEDSKESVEVKSATPIISGLDSDSTVGIDQDKPSTTKSDVSDTDSKTTSDSKIESTESSKKDEKAETKKEESKDEDKKIGKKSTFVDVPESILKAVEEKEQTNLRGETAEVKGDDSEKPKRDPVLESIEGAEKQLSEAFGVVKSKLNSIGKDQKPIKVDCGTTRVRVVCSKQKGKAEETAEVTESKEKKEQPKKEEAPVEVPIETPEAVETPEPTEVEGEEE